ncbi:MAG: diadenylate cyclase CdaA [Thermoanaerobacteraceae bacterium]|nr:diadenylate cyclase CdaA [Thermoanaerobacteraceae bacterium]
MFQDLINLFRMIRIMDIIDMAIIAYVLYRIFVFIRNTRVEQLVKGLFVLLFVTWASGWMGLRTINWILRNAMTVGVIALLIVFQPELRKALETLGRGEFIRRTLLNEENSGEATIDGIVDAVAYLSRAKIGALIVMERDMGLNEVIETGIKLDSLVSSELLINIFIPNTPLHDGAVIIRGDRIMAASCFLPLSENPNLSKELGTRHHAGIGITETSDSVAVIVSEETGTISIAQEGRLSRYLDSKTLKELLKSIFLKQKETKASSWTRWVKK